MTVAALPVLRRLLRRKVNRGNKGIERLFLAQASNQYSQHIADWVRIFFTRLSLCLCPSTTKTYPLNQPQFPSFKSGRISGGNLLQTNTR